MLHEPHHEKTCLCHVRKTKVQISLCSLISAFFVRCPDSIKPLFYKSKISSLYLASVAAQAGLSLPWSQTPKTGFLVMWLTCIPVMTLSMWTGLDSKCRPKLDSLTHICLVDTSILINSGFPQALENMENSWKKIHAWKNHGIWKIMEFWHEMALWMLISIYLTRLMFLKMSVLIEQSSPKHPLLYHETGVVTLIQLSMQHIYFCLIYSHLWQKEDGMPYLNYGKSIIDHGKIMEFYFAFSVGTLSVEQVHFQFLRCLVYFFIFILFWIDIPVSKQLSSWPDTAFCGSWAGAALFAYVPKMGH